MDTDNPENLIAIRRKGTSLSIQTENRYFAITGMDRYGNESSARQSHNIPEVKTIDIPLLKCNGTWLTLPPKDKGLDAKLMVVETLQGSVIATRIYQEKSVNVSNIPNGFYVLKSLGRKGVTHRLGFFTVKRNLATEF